MTDYIDTYYARTLADKTERPALDDTIETDVCVIGGGLAGLNTALGLAERGKKVVVLEGRRLGWGASGRNGGFVLAGYAAGMKAVAAKVGMDQAREMFALTRNAQKLIRSRVKDHNIACDPRDGHLCASWFDDPQAVQAGVDYMNDNFGMNAEFWDTERVRAACNTPFYNQGLFYPDYFHMHPLNYLRSLARVIEAKGGKIFEQSMATGIAPSGNGHTVRTDRGTVKAADVVVCGSAYFNGIEPRLSRSCLPVSTYVMVTDPLPQNVVNETIRVPYAIRDNRWADDYYRLLPDGSLLWGGRVGLGSLNPANLDNLMRGDMLKIYPQLSGAKVRAAWAGTMGYTVHKMPHIRKLGPGLWACTNFGGNGVGPTTAGGEVIAKAIAEGDETYKLFEPFGFSYTGGILGPYVAQAVYYSWELRDRMKEFQAERKAKKNAA